MGDPNKTEIHSASDYGTVASHPERTTEPLYVGPTTDTGVDTLSNDSD
jgi:hypothetical protein